jgi:hypothetical protein
MSDNGLRHFPSLLPWAGEGEGVRANGVHSAR